VALSTELTLTLLYAGVALFLPFFVVPVSRWFTKATFWQMRWLQPVEGRQEENPGFLEHLVNQNLAVVVIRCAYIVAATMIFYKVLVPWSYLIQNQVLAVHESRLPGRELFRFMESFIWTIALTLCFCFICNFLAVFLFNQLTRAKNDFYEIQFKRNAGVALVYATLVVATFFVAGEVAPRLIGWLLTSTPVGR
jgi:hypothetical protein